MIKFKLLLFLSLLFSLNLYSAHFTNKWSVRMDGGREKAVTIAKKHGFRMVDEVLPGIYELEHARVKRASSSPSHHHHQLLQNEEEVLWHEQQRALQRDKRDFFTDPDWPKQWYMNSGKNDHNVLEAYRKYGVSGKGVVVTILDDGVEHNHTDLNPNYDPHASYDFNDNDYDPFPRYEFTNYNKHGTRCAGEVASVANNTKCGAGVAYNAKIGGIRILDGKVTDILEGRGLYFNNQHINIYSASWGPKDNGKRLEGPGKVSQKALHLGVTKGRGGLGSIFVWASGNGGKNDDNCNCDGYTSNIFSISVAAAIQDGNIPYFNERCSSTLATTYTTGKKLNQENNVVTTDLYNKCTTDHSGTSASAPMASGILALALEANPRLTWRDLQHLVVLTSHKGNLRNSEWSKNAVGRYVSHEFGYGLLNAEKLVRYATDWVTVPDQVVCVKEADFEPVKLTENTNVTIELVVQECPRSNVSLDLYKYHHRKESPNITVDEFQNDFPERTGLDLVKHLEHVQAVVSVEAGKRGGVEIHLTSPQGTVSQLLSVRKYDDSDTGIREWPFTTVHNWGERSEGVWKLTVSCHNCTGTLKKWKLILYGTEEDPLQKQLNPPRKLQKSQKLCEKSEYYLNNLCYKHCPQTYYPSRAYLSVIPDSSPFPPFSSSSSSFSSPFSPSSSSSSFSSTPSSSSISSSTIGDMQTTATNTIPLKTIKNKRVKNSDGDSDDDKNERKKKEEKDDDGSLSKRSFHHSPAHPPSPRSFFTHVKSLFGGLINKEVLKEKDEKVFETKICYPCHPTCAKCSGGGAGDCDECIKSHSFTIDQYCLPNNSFKMFFQRSFYIVVILPIMIFFTLVLLLLVFIIKKSRNNSHDYSSLKNEEDDDGYRDEDLGGGVQK